MTQCAKCIMPDSYPGISFDAQGICNLCVDYKPYHSYWGKDKLLETIRSEGGTGEHECVVPISGGKDSTFILYYSVRELGLQPLAVSYDSGFQTEIARENVRNACEALDVPLVVVRSPGNIAAKLLKESLLASARLGSLKDFCGNCEAIIRMVSINAARDHGVPVVLWGSSAFESLSNSSYTQYRSFGQGRAFSIPRILGRVSSKAKVVLQSPAKIRRLPKKLYPYLGYHAIKYNWYSIQQRRKLLFPWKYALRPHSIPPFPEHSPKFVHFFDFITWDSTTYLEILANELHWRHPVEQDTRFDCSIHCLANAQYLARYSISHDAVNFCNYLREGDMSRNDLLAREDHIVNSVGAECQALFDRIGLDNYRLPSEKPW
jgi:hypothetical protein